MLDGELTPSVWQANVGVFREWWRLWKQGRPQRRPDPIAPPSRRERA
jgi:hypothetical protein